MLFVTVLFAVGVISGNGRGSRVSLCIVVELRKPLVGSEEWSVKRYLIPYLWNDDSTSRYKLGHAFSDDILKSMSANCIHSWYDYH